MGGKDGIAQVGDAARAARTRLEPVLDADLEPPEPLIEAFNARAVKSRAAMLPEPEMLMTETLAEPSRRPEPEPDMSRSRESKSPLMR